MPTRNAKWRGRGHERSVGWLPGIADIGDRTQRGHERPVGWYEGLPLLVAAAPSGAVTGWGGGPARSNARALAEARFAQRADPAPQLRSAGRTAAGVSVSDTGFAGEPWEARWVVAHHAQLVAPPQANSRRGHERPVAWDRRGKRWLAGIRQLVETVFGRLQSTFRLEGDRPHDLDGFQARLAAAMALHNVGLWRNRQHGQPDLADVLGW